MNLLWQVHLKGLEHVKYVLTPQRRFTQGPRCPDEHAQDPGAHARAVQLRVNISKADGSFN